jgi:hypothetical protein
VRWSASRGSEYEKLCRQARPGAAVAIDVGLRDIGSERPCRHKRTRHSLVRAMTAEEVASVRAMAESRWDGGTRVPAPMEPEVSEISTGSCDWNGNEGRFPFPPDGEVARADARWGAVTVKCTVGSDGFGALMSHTLLLVGRAGTSGPFTRLAAHTNMSWSSYGSLCGTRATWPVPPAPRVALDFCVPFPAAVSGDLR